MQGHQKQDAFWDYEGKGGRAGGGSMAMIIRSKVHVWNLKRGDGGIGGDGLASPFDNVGRLC